MARRSCHNRDHPDGEQSGEDKEDRPMADDRDALRDWHRLFGLLLTDFFTGSPFIVEVERDLSEQQRFLDVVILRRRPGRFVGTLPDGLDGLAAHNLITFKSHREALDAWAMKELIGHYVAYRKLASPSLSELLPEEDFRLYAVCARFPHNLSGQAPWQERQAGVYDCKWGTDEVRVVVAGELPREAHNAPLHLFSASPELIGFGGMTYRRRSKNTSAMLGQLLEQVRGEGLTMSFTMEDFQREYAREHFARLTPEEQREALARLSPERRREVLLSLPPEERLAGLPLEQRLAGLSAEQIRQYLERLTADPPAEPRKSRRKR
jgi:hypothetical protein